jgi:hypothetical protein
MLHLEFGRQWILGKALRSGVTDKLIDGTDDQDGEHVEIYVE